MSPPYLIALQGFSAAELRSLDAGFRLSALRQPQYQATRGLEQGEFVIANAERAAAVAAVVEAGRVHEAVFIGERAPAGAAAQLARPIDPLQVLRELDALALLRHGGWPRETPGPATRERDAKRSPGGRRRADRRGPAPSRTPYAPLAVLLVESTPGELAGLETALERHQALVWRCDDAAARAQRLAEGEFDLVIVADGGAIAGWDARTVCLELRLLLGSPAEHTRLVIARSQGGEDEPALAALAGCDGWLHWPAGEDTLVPLLRQLGLQRDDAPAR